MEIDSVVPYSNKLHAEGLSRPDTGIQAGDILSIDDHACQYYFRGTIDLAQYHSAWPIDIVYSVYHM